MKLLASGVQILNQAIPAWTSVSYNAVTFAKPATRKVRRRLCPFQRQPGAPRRGRGLAPGCLAIPGVVGMRWEWSRSAAL